MIDQLIESLWWALGFSFVMGVLYNITLEKGMEYKDKPIGYKVLNVLSLSCIFLVANCYVIRPWL